ncbi:MAG: aldehyde dehydrogenase [Bradyrhizobium sp.]|nr:aldehyde dehydrogenase [Bradyrhizobium sp.]
MPLTLDQTYLPLIGGEFKALTKTTFDAINPATGEKLAEIARCGASDIDAAVFAAREAFPGWKKTSSAHRAMLLLKLADYIEANLERFALIDASDIGRRLWETRLDHQYAINQYRYFAAAALTVEDFGGPIGDGRFMGVREPIGVCGQIIPWNVPAIITAFKLAPALAAGNTLVLKPDENASLSTLELAKHLATLFPAGVVNVVPGFGDEAGAALTAHPDVAKLAFTGSTEVGRIIARAGADRLVPVTLELGGKSPNIVFPDIEDLDAVVDNAAFGSMYCNGQACLAGTRLFVHEDIYPQFIAKLVTAFEALKVGSPIEEGTKISCLVSEKQGERVLEYIEIGKAEGAKLLTGGSRVEIPGNEHGYFIEPTIFEGTNDMRIAQEEIFGPVLTVIRWNDFDKMIGEANNTRYGLAAGLYTSNVGNALKTAELLEAGSVWINQYCVLADGVPFGGYKESGIGREMCKDTMNLYTQIKSITVMPEVPKPWYA